MEDFIAPNGEPQILPPERENIFKSKKLYYYSAGILVLLFLIKILLFNAPANFPVGTIINIGDGAGLRSVSLELKEANIIRSRTIFEAFVILYGGDRHVISADYLFDVREPVWSVARRISEGDRHLAPVKITIPEGFDTGNIADLLDSRLSTFDKDRFIKIAEGKEGSLFPDTYFFFTTDNEEVAFNSLIKNYEKKVGPLRDEIKKTGKTEQDIVTMASIIEREAEGNGDRAVISGILWRRISIGMALQADAAPITYKERGLPSTPIANPGLDSIKAAIYPEKTTYLYYLHDKEGGIHYAKNFDEHRANITKYLK